MFLAAYFFVVIFSVAVLTFGCTGRNRRAASFFLKNICANKFNKFSNLWRSVAPVNLFVRMQKVTYFLFDRNGKYDR